MTETVAVEKGRGLWGSAAGKGKIASKIVQRIPPHRTYVEPFAGGAAVFFAKAKGISQDEVLSDNDSEIAAAFRFVRNAQPEQIARLKRFDWTGSVEALKRSHQARQSSDIVKRFWGFSFCRWASFMRRSDKSTGIDPQKIGKRATIPDRIDTVKERLRNVSIRSSDYRKTIKDTDSEETFFYLDPPYVNLKQGCGEDVFDEAKFIETLKSIKGKFLLNYDARRKAFFEGNGWHIRTFSAHGVGPKGPKEYRYLEATNYNPSQAIGAAALAANAKDSDEAQAAKADELAEDFSTNELAEIPRDGGTIQILKTAEERFVLGVVLEPNDGHGGAPLSPDTQGDVYSAEEIRHAAHLFMDRYRNLGLAHKRILAQGRVSILESYLSPIGFFVDGAGQTYSEPPTGALGKAADLEEIRKGTWLLALRVHDDALWAAIKEGKLTGLSIGGSARRVQEKTT